MQVPPNNNSANDNHSNSSRRSSPRFGRRMWPLVVDDEDTDFEGVRCSSQVAKKNLVETFEQLSPSQKVLLARQLGYESFDSLLDASTVVTLSDGSAWWLTADRFGAWTAWNLCALQLARSGQNGETTAGVG